MDAEFSELGEELDVEEEKIHQNAKLKTIFISFGVVIVVVSILLCVCCLLGLLVGGVVGGILAIIGKGKDDAFFNQLDNVELWGYQIQHIENKPNRDALIASKYDLLVIEPTQTDKGNSAFDCAGFVSELHNSDSKNRASKLVIAYVDIGEAEDWRYYWDNWTEPTNTSRGVPDFLITVDPDGWVGNFPVAYWDQRWKKGAEKSMLQRIIDWGFDGIYMDWVEAFESVPIIDAAASDGVDPKDEMIKFIREIRTYAQARNPAFHVIQQNAPALHEGKDSELFPIIDGYAQEQWIFDGEADVDWGDPTGGDERIPAANNPGYSTEWYNEKMDYYIANSVPVFGCNYALIDANIDESYAKAGQKGYKEFVSQRSLQKLPTKKHPNYPL